jgi:hypothetical protein
LSEPLLEVLDVQQSVAIGELRQISDGILTRHYHPAAIQLEAHEFRIGEAKELVVARSRGTKG